MCMIFFLKYPCNKLKFFIYWNNSMCSWSLFNPDPSFNKKQLSNAINPIKFHNCKLSFVLKSFSQGTGKWHLLLDKEVYNVVDSRLLSSWGFMILRLAQREGLNDWWVFQDAGFSNGHHDSCASKTNEPLLSKKRKESPSGLWFFNVHSLPTRQLIV